MFRIGYGAATAVHLALVMMRWLDSDTSDRFRCEAKDIETQLGQAAGLFDAFRGAVDRLAHALDRQVSSSSSYGDVFSGNKHISHEENIYSNSKNHYSHQHQHQHQHQQYRVSDEETAKMLASAQGLAEDLKRI